MATVNNTYMEKDDHNSGANTAMGITEYRSPQEDGKEWWDESRNQHMLTTADIESIKQIVHETVQNAMCSVRPADKATITIDEAAELYNIGRNRLRLFRASEPNNKMFIYVNGKVLIKRKLFEAWLEEKYVFPF